MVDVAQNLPAPNETWFDPKSGVPTVTFYRFMLSLWNRTGGGTGGDIDEVRATADAALADANASLKIVLNLSDLANDITARANLGLSDLATALPVTGWIDPTGAGSRAAFDMNWTTTVGAAYSQAEATAIRDQLIAVQKRLGQVILDQIAVGTLGH